MDPRDKEPTGWKEDILSSNTSMQEALIAATLLVEKNRGRCSKLVSVLSHLQQNVSGVSNALEKNGVVNESVSPVDHNSIPPNPKHHRSSFPTTQQLRLL